MVTAHATIHVDITTALMERTGLTAVAIAKAAAFVAACQGAGISLDQIQAAVYAVCPAQAELIREAYVWMMTGNKE